MPKAATLTVLVVEDEFLIRETIVTYLNEAGCRTVEADSGESAVKLFHERNGFDVVLTDIRLGGTLSGWDVGEAARAEHDDIPIIYTSGAVVLPERRVEGSIFLAKPYDPDVVLRTCRRLAEDRENSSRGSSGGAASDPNAGRPPIGG